jgi:hypothetical protein
MGIGGPMSEVCATPCDFSILSDNGRLQSAIREAPRARAHLLHRAPPLPKCRPRPFSRSDPWRGREGCLALRHASEPTGVGVPKVQTDRAVAHRFERVPAGGDSAPTTTFDREEHVLPPRTCAVDSSPAVKDEVDRDNHGGAVAWSTNDDATTRGVALQSPRR